MIPSFKNYLVEEEKTLYFVWGRMNPPTAGHEKLLDFLKSKAGNNPFRIYLTQSEDNTKNPIPFVQKVKFARKGFPQYARQIMMDKKLKTIFDAMTSFYNEGFKRIVVVAGEDRVREYDITLNKYNGKKGRHGFYNFERINVLSAGKRDPESKGVEGVSGTKLRGYAESGDFTKFSQYMPKKLSNADAKSVYNAVRKGIGLKEEKQFKNHVQLEPISDLREAYVKGLYQVGEEVVIRDKGIIGTINVLGSNYLVVESKGEKWRVWLDGVDKVNPNYDYFGIMPSGEVQKTNEEMKYDFGTPESTRISKKKTPGQNEARQDPDIKDRPGAQPAGYHTGLKKSTKIARDRQFKRQAKMSDDDPKAYKPAPGDKGAKTKLSKHTKRFRQMFGED